MYEKTSFTEQVGRSFTEWLFVPENFSGLSRNGPLCSNPDYFDTTIIIIMWSAFVGSPFCSETFFTKN